MGSGTQPLFWNRFKDTHSADKTTIKKKKKKKKMNKSVQSPENELIDVIDVIGGCSVNLSSWPKRNQDMKIVPFFLFLQNRNVVVNEAFSSRLVT